MSAYIKENVFQIILVALLTIVVAVCSFFAQKSDSNEKRIVQLGEFRVANATNITNLQKTMDDRFSALSRQLEQSDRRLAKQLESNRALMQAILEKNH